MPIKREDKAERKMLRTVAIVTALLQVAVAQLDASTCGRQKGCLFAPQGCNTGGSCQLTMSYVMDGSDMVFELQGKAPAGGYMAIGFSYDMQMGNDSVSLCHGNQQMLAYNQGRSTIPVNGTKHMLEAFTATNGETYCRIRRGIRGNGNPQVFNLDQPYNIFLAFGPMNGNSVGYHQANKWMMPKQELSAYSTVGGFNPSTQSPIEGAANGTMAPPGATSARPAPNTTPAAGRNAANNDLVSLFGCAALALALLSFTRF